MNADLVNYNMKASLLRLDMQILVSSKPCKIASKRCTTDYKHTKTVTPTLLKNVLFFFFVDIFLTMRQKKKTQTPKGYHVHNWKIYRIYKFMILFIIFAICIGMPLKFLNILLCCDVSANIKYYVSSKKVVGMDATFSYTDNLNLY